MQKIGLGGGCHWCTEAIFQSLRGVDLVEQGWIGAADIGESTPSEAVIVHFDPTLISLEVLIGIHLHTHNATSNHTFRAKYRSAVYSFNEAQHSEAASILRQKQSLFDKPLVTGVYRFATFRRNLPQYLNYYRRDPQKLFCQTRITPKLKILMKQYEAFYQSLQ